MPDRPPDGGGTTSDPRLRPLQELIAGWPGLTSRPDPALIEDSLVLVPHLQGVRRLADVGSGGGLPGLPLKIALPALEVTLIESNRRKAAFLVAAAAQLGLTGVEVIPARAEQAGRDPRLREAFDAVTVRALAHMAVLAELCLPLVRVGGRLLAMKAGAEAEVEAAIPAVEALGGRLAGIVPAPSPARARGQVVIVEMTGPTPDRYPRRAGLPERRPLGI